MKKQERQRNQLERESSTLRTKQKISSMPTHTPHPTNLTRKTNTAFINEMKIILTQQNHHTFYSPTTMSHTKLALPMQCIIPRHKNKSYSPANGCCKDLAAVLLTFVASSSSSPPPPPEGLAPGADTSTE